MENSNTKKGKEEILELERKSCEMFQNKEIDKAMELFADDVLLLNPGAELIKGKEAERESLTAASQLEGFELSWEPTDVHVSSSEDLAYVYGVIKSKMKDEEEQFEKYVTIWKKINSEWKLALQMRNSNK